MVDAIRPAPLDDDDDDDGADRPHRLCAVTRLERDPADLIRFVAGPDGVIVADLARRLPGRGVWVTARKAVIAEAIKKKCFAKSLKRQVHAAEDLPDRIEDLLLARVLNALSMAKKAGLVTSGFAQVDALIESGKVVALLHGSDGATGGRDKLDRKYTAIAQSRGHRPVIIGRLTISQISLAIGRANVVHAAITHGGLSLRLLDEAERLTRFAASDIASQTASTPDITD